MRGSREFKYDGVVEASINDDFSDIKVTYYINDNVIDTQSLTSDSLILNGERILNQGESFKAVIEGKDSYGYIHESILFEVRCDGTGLTQIAYLNTDIENIFDGNGNLLCGNLTYRKK